jgi:hypothetical protein
MTLATLLLAIFLGFILDGASTDVEDLKSVVLVLLAVCAVPWIGSASRNKPGMSKDPLLSGLIALYLLLMFQPLEWSAEAWNQVLLTAILWVGLLVIGTWHPQPERKHRSSSGGKGHRSGKDHRRRKSAETE